MVGFVVSLRGLRPPVKCRSLNVCVSMTVRGMEDGSPFSLQHAAKRRHRRVPFESSRVRETEKGEFGRVGCYCAAEEFDMDEIERCLLEEPSLEVTMYKDSVHFRNKHLEEESVFVFPYGAVVIWGMDVGSERVVLNDLKPFQHSSLDVPHIDTFRYSYNKSAGIDKEAMCLTRGSGPQERLSERLALSHALAQSVKLSAFENSVQNTIAATRHLPAELAKNGRISSSRREVSKNVGRLFVDRHNVYLYSDILDTPHHFWDYETHEWLYASAARYLEVNTRAEGLFRRLEMVRELYDLLGHELQFKHSSDLEIIIIGLITFEILIALAHDWVEAVASGSLGEETGNVVAFLFLAMSLGLFLGVIAVTMLERGKNLLNTRQP